MTQKKLKKNKKPTPVLVKNTPDLPDGFSRRLHHYFVSVFEKSEKYFFSKEYYLDVAYFCSQNNINLSLSEFLAINFHFFAENKNIDSVSFMKEYLEVERKNHGIQFLNFHINRATLIMKSLKSNLDVMAGASSTVASCAKIKDILNIYYSYSPEEFNTLTQAKIQDFHKDNSSFLAIEEAFQAQFLELENQLTKNVFTTSKFQVLLEPFVKENIVEFMATHKAEGEFFKAQRMRLN